MPVGVMMTDVVFQRSESKRVSVYW